ncbi:MAG: methyltransferase domain-containing protein [Patescibacteria group bacterium UBA2103]
MRNFVKEFKRRNLYLKGGREIFYDLAGEYLPENDDAVVVDVGSGFGVFAKHLGLHDRYKNLHLLDGSKEAFRVVPLTTLYTIPEKLPFKDESVDFLHASHIVEHLYYEDLHFFMKEVNRTLKNGGVFVVSAPLFWKKFFGNLTHIKPYEPRMFERYLGPEGNGPTAGTTLPKIADTFHTERLEYRYTEHGSVSELGSRYFVVDVLMKITQNILWHFGFRRYQKNGYTLVLRKLESVEKK